MRNTVAPAGSTISAVRRTPTVTGTSVPPTVRSWVTITVRVCTVPPRSAAIRDARQLVLERLHLAQVEPGRGRALRARADVLAELAAHRVRAVLALQRGAVVGRRLAGDLLSTTPSVITTIVRPSDDVADCVRKPPLLWRATGTSALATNGFHAAFQVAAGLAGAGSAR